MKKLRALPAFKFVPKIRLNYHSYTNTGIAIVNILLIFTKLFVKRAKC